MVKRLLDANASELYAMSGSDLTESIRLAEGRTVAAEVICTAQSPVGGVSHGELAAAMSADIIVLDEYDPRQPVINGIPDEILSFPAPLNVYKRLLGRPVGINMIVADPEAGEFLGGRLVTPENIDLAVKHGADIIFLYARPKIGGTPESQAEAVRMLKAGSASHKMIVAVPSFTKPAPRDTAGIAAYAIEMTALLEAGCNGIGLPMPGSKQGWKTDSCARLVDTCHRAGALAWLFITGSVEGAPESVMHDLALTAKQIGADAVRLDEAGLSGMPAPENILAFSLALRGKRHTYRRMAASIRR